MSEITDLSEIEIRQPTLADSEIWRDLFQAYSDGMGGEIANAPADRIWGWIADANHALECLLARTVAGEPVGFVLFHTVPIPRAGANGGALTDFFVAPKHRQAGIGDALLYAVVALGRRRGWVSAHWHVGAREYRALALSDRHGRRQQTVPFAIDLLADDAEPG